MLKEMMNKKGNELTVKESLVLAGYCVLGYGVFVAGIFAGSYAYNKFRDKLDERKEKKNQ